MLDYIKTFCNIPQAVTVYDDQLTLFKSIAVAKLTKNGIEVDETKPLIRDFISTYCRLNIVTEPAEQWRNAELRRLDHLQELMYYGGV